MSQTPEMQLVDLGFHLITPDRRLHPYISALWIFRRETPLQTIREEAMHPTGGFGLLFNLGDALLLDTVPLSTSVYLDGVNTRSRRLYFSGHIDLIGIRFREGGAYPFFGVPLVELQNEHHVLDALREPSLVRLHARLWETPSQAARVAMLEGWLLERLAVGLTRSAIIPESLARLRSQITGLREGDPRLTMPKLAETLAISQRQLEQLYRTQVGITPMEYARLQRVEMARLALKDQKQSNTRLAADLGYHDQAHFIRDFSAVIGLTPHAYMLRKHPKSNPD
ncbi:MAG: helix-turn-helix transcriptional regulator [Anaerolineae bacterium]